MSGDNNIIYKVKITLETVKKIADDLYRNEYNVNDSELKKIVELVQSVYSFMLKNIVKYLDKGIDIPKDILIVQYNNLIEGINEGDYILLADTLLYEISNTLNYFIEIGKNIYE